MKISMDIAVWEAEKENNERNFRSSIATLLGIDIGRIKIVSVEAGSVNIQYDIEEDKPILTAEETEDPITDSISAEAPLANVPVEMMLADAADQGMNETEAL